MILLQYDRTIKALKSSVLYSDYICTIFVQPIKHGVVKYCARLVQVTCGVLCSIRDIGVNSNLVC